MVVCIGKKLQLGARGCGGADLIKLLNLLFMRPQALDATRVKSIKGELSVK
jgi:hypothetical protein